MKNKRIYYRWKEGSIVIEGKSKGKTLHLKTLPKDPIKLFDVMHKASFITEEEYIEILTKIESLDSKAERRTKGSPNLRLNRITRTQENDAFSKV